ncbi:MAG: PfkB family carbohydrate kinase [Solirubrobacteraceae bacterium]
MSAPSVLVVGSVNVDLVAAVASLPRPGETVIGPGVGSHGGGKGANAAVAAARLGASVALIGAVGDDDFGSRALSDLRAESVDVEAVAVLADVPTGAALIVVDAAGENQIAVGAGANHALEPGAVAAAMADRLAGCGCVVISAEVSDACVATAVRVARDAGVPCVLNPAPARAGLLGAIDAGPILTPNDGEASLLGGAAALARRAGAPVVVTRGAQGAAIVGPGGEVAPIPAPAVDAVDTTGAGDSLTGALAARLAAGDALEPAARYAVIAAALSVTAAGARGGMPTVVQVARAAPNVARACGPAPGRST